MVLLDSGCPELMHVYNAQSQMSKQSRACKICDVAALPDNHSRF